MKTSKSISLGRLGDSIGYRMRVAHSAIFKELDREMSKLQMTTAMYGALELLDNNTDLTQTDIAGALGLTRSTMVPMLDKLEARGLIQRLRSKGDRRSNQLALTAEGRRLHAKLRAKVDSHEKWLLFLLRDNDAQQLLSALRALGRSAPQ